MIIRSLQGDDEINAALSASMYATVDKLIAEGWLAEDVGRAFMDSHVALLVNPNGGFAEFWKRAFGIAEKDTPSKVVVMKA